MNSKTGTNYGPVWKQTMRGMQTLALAVDRDFNNWCSIYRCERAEELYAVKHQISNEPIFLGTNDLDEAMELVTTMYQIECSPNRKS